MIRRSRLLCRSAGAHATIAAAMTAALFALAAPGASAQQQTPPPPGSNCRTQDHRAFDFWLGSWVVTNPAGQQVGMNELTQIASGCAMLENWVASNGAPGTSINYFDRSDGKWHQLWTGSDGTILHLAGGLVDGAMVLTGERSTPRGDVMDRITWSTEEGGRVRQLWEISTDGGKTWQASFNGLYSPAGG